MNLEQFVHKHYEYLKSCFRIYGYIKEDVEDYSHDLILELGESNQNIPDTGTRGWIFAVVRNKVRAARRASSIAPVLVSLSIREHDCIEVVETYELYDEVIQDADESQAWLDTSILELLCDLEYGLSMVQAAEMRNVTYQKYSRAIREWKERMKDDQRNKTSQR